MSCESAVARAGRFLANERLRFAEADALWKELKRCDQLSLARRVLARMRQESDCLSDGVPNQKATRDKLRQQEALLTSKDPELDAAIRHDDAVKLLADRFDFIEDKTIGGDGETLGIAGGICKRKWLDLGQVKDLLQATDFYERGAQNEFGADAYPHINAAFVNDLLAAMGNQPEKRKLYANQMRERILEGLAADGTWFNAATRSEAQFGLGEYGKATEEIKRVDVANKPATWELRTMAEQLAQLAYLRKERPLDDAGIRNFFETLLPGAGDAISSVFIGKVGLALSGGGFRASFFHLGFLACLAERDVLRHVEVMSCVSGGSIAGACYWLKLRERMLKPEPLTRDDYVALVSELMTHFKDAVQTDLRGQVQPGIGRLIWRVVGGQQGVLDPEETASELDRVFYGPLWQGARPVWMHELPFKPADHNPELAGTDNFNPGQHNWLRAHKVPALILNATTVNTGHAWHFTPTWMGESPWATHQSADSVPRLQWNGYEPQKGWRIELGRAVAASACVPMVFAPLRLGQFYEQSIEVSLVDGGVCDNQGAGTLLATGCNVVLVSDACGQLKLDPSPTTGLRGLPSAATRSMDTLMERVRLANFGDLNARLFSGLLRGLMFLHMKAGLDADVIHLRDFYYEAYTIQRAPLSPSGVRKDFQQALAELRTDLDIFTNAEANGLMACGYQMAGKAIEFQLPKLRDLWTGTPHHDWPFKDMLAEITSIANTTPRRTSLLEELRAGGTVRI
jgi:predicted acylesterase/phospholipase RssA